MALTGLEFKDWEKGSTLLSASGERCFFCGAVTYDPAFVWSGANGEVYMHVSCALNFGIRLMHDVRQYQKQTGLMATTTST